MPLKHISLAMQHCAPQQLLSRAIGRLAGAKTPWIKNTFIKWFIQRYQVNMSEAVLEKPEDYPDFNHFFTRTLKPELRPIDNSAGSIISPVDGSISQIGVLSAQKILQAKNFSFSVDDLLGGSVARAQPFHNGHFATLYLAPKDYHRIHMPFSGQLREMIHIPGKLFSVNVFSAENIPSIFARNERVACIFDTAIGAMAVILVGAMIVASINTVWAGTVTPPSQPEIRSWEYLQTPEQHIALSRGAELGYFQLGSTVILLFPPGKIRWENNLNAGNTVRFGQKIGRVN